MNNYNIVSIILAAVFLLPILSGIMQPFSGRRVQYSLGRLLDNLEFLFAIFISVYLTKKIFFEHSSGFYKQIYDFIPENIKTFLYGQDILAYLIVVPVLLLFVLFLLRLFTNPAYRYIIMPVSARISTVIDSMGGAARGFMGALWQVPRSIYLVFVVGLALNFYAYYFPNPQLSGWMNDSPTYQTLYKNAINPVLNSNIAKKIPVIINDSFARTVGRISPIDEATGEGLSREQLIKQLAGRNIRVIEYFNGVTLDEAVKSSPEIDETTKMIVGNEKNDKKKALMLYRWITQNISYDYDKAQRLGKDPKGISSGAIDAFKTRKGVCFDYASLYVAMCRAAGVKVRLVTGLGYSGVSWGDHAWNQVYASDEDRWINVDSTFGTAGNYFDKRDFKVDHRYDDIQGEW